MAQTAVITGSSGFVGRRLAIDLINRGYRVYGIDRSPNSANHRTYRVDLVYHRADELADLFNVLDPDLIFHLAGMAQTRSDPELTRLVNIEGTRNLLQAVLWMRKSTRVITVGSIDEIGSPLRTLATVDEMTPLEPESVYGQSKRDAWHLCQQFIESGLDIVHAAPTNHKGGGQGLGFLGPDVTNQMAIIEAIIEDGDNPECVIRTGFLGDAKAFLHVDDVVRAYYLLSQTGRSGERYLIGSPRQYTMYEIVSSIMSRYRYHDTHPLILQSAPPTRQAIKHAMIDYRKITRDTGWQPELSLERAIDDLVAYYRGLY
jgi:GDP-4-dehydro-6-deoxy-D-mannose reductase